MRLLLDTHVILWWLVNPSFLKKEAYEAIKNGENDVFVSVASLWELFIKEAKGKITIPEDLEKEIIEERFTLLSINLFHVLQVKNLPIIAHKDPFDRILVAQAQVEDLTIVTRDSQLQNYNVQLLMA